MPEISFYILASSSAEERDLFACKLAEKAYRQGIYSNILTQSDVHSSSMDDLLWTFRANSFVPHQVFTLENQEDVLPQILLSADPNNFKTGKALINLSSHPIIHSNQFERILEVLYQEDSHLQAGRERYRTYQQAGFHIVTHKI